MSSSKEIVACDQLQIGHMYKNKLPGSEPFFLLEIVVNGKPNGLDYYYWAKVLSGETVADCLFHSTYKFIKLT